MITAYAQQRSGQLDQALESYETLSRLQPSNRTWSQWIRNIQLRRGMARCRATPSKPRPRRRRLAIVSALPAGEIAGPPPISWSSFAGEFLKEHSQELLLCLAVLLIVVSSTVGAHLLLGLALVAGGQMHAGDGRDTAVRGVRSWALAMGR